MIRSGPEKFFTSSNSTIFINPIEGAIGVRGFSRQRKRFLAPATSNYWCSFSKLVRHCSKQSWFVSGCPFLYLKSSNPVVFPFRKQPVRCKFFWHWHCVWLA